MNKKLLAAMLVLLLVIGASMAYVLWRNSSTRPAENSNGAREKQADDQQVVMPHSSEGVYIDYTEGSFAASTGERLLFFHAPWCPQCRALDESIKTSELPSGLTIFKIDYDSSQQLRVKYGVTLQTTVVKVDGNGSKIDSFVAYDEPTFQSVKQALLP